MTIGEFVNEELQNYFSFKGKKHEKTIPYPQRNCLSERGNGTCLAMARKILIEAHLPLTCWLLLQHIFTVLYQAKQNLIKYLWRYGLDENL